MHPYGHVHTCAHCQHVLPQHMVEHWEEIHRQHRFLVVEGKLHHVHEGVGPVWCMAWVVCVVCCVHMYACVPKPCANRDVDVAYRYECACIVRINCCARIEF